MSGISRRRALQFGLFTCATVLAACSGFEDSVTSRLTPSPGSGSSSPGSGSSPSPSPSGPAPWTLATLFLAAGVAGTMDLGPTLPSGVQRGGTFGVSSSGKALPSGMTLSPSGTLSIGSAAAGQSAVGVVFTYQEP